MPQDVIEACPYVIKHRMICRGYNVNGGEERAADEVLRQVLAAVAVPTENE